MIFSENFACPYCNYSLKELEPRIFSFNAPYGACPECKGLGFHLRIDEDLLIPDKGKTLNQGAIVPLKNMEDTNIYIRKLEIVCNKYKIDMDKPIEKLKRKELDIILYGSSELIRFKFSTKNGNPIDEKNYTIEIK